MVAAQHTPSHNMHSVDLTHDLPPVPGPSSARLHAPKARIASAVPSHISPTNRSGYFGLLTEHINGNGGSGSASRPGTPDMDQPGTPRPRMLTPSPPRTRDHSPSRWEEEGDIARLLRTIDFAARKHESQRRKDVDQTPYINHPIAVANFLSSTGVVDVRVIQAAILHDTVEDTHTTLDELERTFGPEVARIVAECSDDQRLSGNERKAEQIRTAPYKSREAQQVKLADKLHNLESIRRNPPVGWGLRRIQNYFIWAKKVTDICAPSHPALAERLALLYEHAYTRVDGKYYPCHPDVCGPMTEAEKDRIDARLIALKAGERMHPNPIFF